MVLPLIAVTFLEWLYFITTRKAYTDRSVFVVGIISASNVAGVLCANIVPAEKHEIFGSILFSVENDIISSIVSSVINACSLFADCGIIAAGALLAACIYILYAVFRKADLREDNLLIFLLLCISSVLVILAIDILTTMYVRQIYFFLLFPMAAVVAAYLYSYSKNLKPVLAAGLIVFSLINYNQDRRMYIQQQNEYTPLEAVSAYLEENSISTVYSYWNLGEKIAIASDFHIEAGFWNGPADVFHSIEYLCDPSVFDADPSDCAYIVSGAQNLSLVKEAAYNKHADIQILKYFPELDLYVLSSDVILMD